MERDRDRIESDIASVVYYMNGGLSFTDAYGLSTQQLKRLGDTITTHFEKQNEAIKKTQSKRPG
jgi:hypothetical protein